MNRTTPVAVVGLGALTPGATDVAGFWRTVLTGRDLMGSVPESRWLVEDHYDPDPEAVDKTYARRGAFLDPVDFDPMAFGVQPNAVQATDTTQLLALMVADAVLRDCSGTVDRDRVSVILGSAPLELLYNVASRLQRPVWLKSLREAGIGERKAQEICDRIADHYVPWQECTFPGLLSNVVAGRIANRFDLHGTNYTVDAACASSLAAIANAVAELALGTSDLVITGGVDTLNDIMMYMCFSKTPALSPTGDCRPFAEAADGTMLGEGLVMFALKRLDDAERDGDRIYAVIRGIGTSSDGNGTAIYAPLPAGQARALRQAYENAGYGPDTVELVEAHGTGTTIGDAAEFDALREVLAESGRGDHQWCALGSIKSQIGHTKAAAGAAGLLKAVLAVHHGVLPPTIKVDRPNPRLELETSPLYLNTRARPWVRGPEHPRRASVSSFGFGGSNFHLTLEEYTGEHRACRVRALPSELVLLSASSVDALISSARSLRGSLSDIARCTQSAFDLSAPERLAVVAEDLADFQSKVDRFDRHRSSLPGVFHASGSARPGAVAFLFPGQGSQYVGMGADVAMHFPQSGAVWDRLAEPGLHRTTFPVPVFTDEERARQEELLTATERAQPALALVSLALLEVLGTLGLRASCAAGHSLGELVALHYAGVLSESDLVALTRRRGELMRDAAQVPGAMLAVTASRDEVSSVLAGGEEWWIANHNSPTQVIVSGTMRGVAAAERALHGFTTRRLNTVTAFHSPIVAAADAPLLEYLGSVDVRSPSLPVYGNADAAVYPAAPDEIRRRIASHLTSQVRFVDQITAMYDAGARTFVEVGAGATVSRLVGQILGDRPHVAVSLDRKGCNGVTSLHEALGRLAVTGLEMDFAALWADYGPEPELQAPKPRMTMSISGANHGRSYPPARGAAGLPPPNPDEVAPAVLAGATEAGWLATFQEMQRQTAEVHAAYQKSMTESHLTFLRATELSLRSLGGEEFAEQPVTAAVPPPEPVTVVPPPAEVTPLPPRSADPCMELLSVVSDKTGYPVEMLDLGMELESDLGIDSIKRVEILSAFRERSPDLPEADLAELGKLRTLAEIAAMVGGTPADDVATLPCAAVLTRQVVRMTRGETSGLMMAGLDDGELVVTDDGDGVAELVAARLAEHGIAARVVGEVPADAYGVVFLGGLRPVRTEDEALAVNHEAFLAARAVAASFVTKPGVFVTVQDTGGDFGLRGSAPLRAWLGGVAGLTRTAAREWPGVAVKAIDCERGDRDAGEVASAIVHELVHGGPTTDVGLRADGTRWTVGTTITPVDAAASSRIDSDSVIVVTGGGRGVTAAALIALAETHQPGLVLLGRTVLTDEAPALRGITSEAELKRALVDDAHRRTGTRPSPAEIGAEAARLLAVREVRRTLAALEQAGSKVWYMPVDVTDFRAVARALEEVRREWGRITGLVHGAGVVADKRIADKTDEQFTRVFDTKVTGLRSLLAATRDDPISVLCLFSSLAARCGNAGQSDYAMANEILNQVGCAEQTKNPGLLVRSIGWGAWEGGMVTPSLARHFGDAGVGLIPLDEGAAAFVGELAGPPGVVQVVIAPESTDSPGGEDHVARVAQVVVSGRTHPHLADHQVAGKPVLPVALALEWLTSLVADSPGPLALRDIAVLRKITLPGLGSAGHRIGVRLDSGGLHLTGDNGLAHYRAQVAPVTGPSSWDAPLADVTKQVVYDGDLLFHGPRFQSIRELRQITDSGASALVCGARGLEWAGAHWRTDPAAVDACLQLAVLWSHRLLRAASLPMGIREFRLHRPGLIDGVVNCVLRAGSVRESRAECDVALIDLDGSVRAELLGVSVIRRPR
ncbi:hypothetical protein GCM10022267_84900 [Lentzea roselyniae]|uniref:Polyketide-type polyunsaturated fatty acid synthase PfaA n=1 Tax=Lentzea roselyniae TaxID=531940 RepID=A0ABP7CBU8_9PSEU